MANKIKYGLEQVHIAFFSDTSTDETPAWDEPTPIKGAVSLSISPEGDESDFYADNTKYWTYFANNGYTGDLEVALLPDSVLTEMLGMTTDDNGMLVESANDKPKEFALMGQVQGDEKNRRFVYYRCKASRPSEENSTQEASITPTTDTVSVTIMPLGADKTVRGVLELSDTNKTVYDAFFDSVALPTVTPAPEA